MTRQLDERQRIQDAVRKMRETRAQEIMQIRKEIAAYVAMKRGDVPSLAKSTQSIEQAKTKMRERKRQGSDRQRERQRQRSRDRGSDRGREF